MPEYIERTENLILAANAGARVIENTKRYHGASYCIGLFTECRKEIPYLKAAEILRDLDTIPAADVVPVVRCNKCKWYCNSMCYHPRFDYVCETPPTVFRFDYCRYGEEKEENK